MFETLEEILKIAADIIAIGSVVPLSLFVYFYGTKQVKRADGKRHYRRYSNAWRQTKLGESLMIQKIAWIIVLLFIGASLIFGDWPGREVMRILLYGGLNTMFWVIFYRLRRIQTGRDTDMNIMKERARSSRIS